MHNRLDGFARKKSRVVNHAIVQSGGKALLQFREFSPHGVGSIDGVRSRKLKDDEGGGRLTAVLRGNGVVTRRQFHSSYIADARDLALRPLLDDNLPELLFIEQPTLCVDRALKILSRRNGRLANCAGRHLKVLFADGADNITGSHVSRSEPFRVEPD